MSQSTREAERDLQRALYSASGESYALIFNIANFAPPRLLPARWGSEKDVVEAKKVLEERNFTVHSFPDCTADEIRKRLKVIGDDQRNFERYRCLFVLVMSHGYQNGIYASDGSCLSFNEIQSFLTAAACPAFRNKPKLVCVQSCREKSVNSPDDSVRVLEEDIHLSFAGQLFSKTFIHSEKGAYYIRYLFETINELGDDEDLQSILTEVTRKMKDASLPLPDNRGLLRDKVYLPMKRVRKIIHGREKQESKGGELVTPTSSISIDGSMSFARNKFPRVSKKKRCKSPDSSGVEIEKSFDKSTNHEAPSMTFLSDLRPPQCYMLQSVRISSVALLINNNVDASHCLPLKTVFEEICQYSVIVLENVAKDCLYSILGAVLNESTLESFVFIFTSAGGNNSLLDSNGEIICTKELLRHIASLIISTCNAFVVLQTVVIADDQTRVSIGEMSQLSRSLNLCSDKETRLIVSHVSVSSPILSSLADRIEEFHKYNHYWVESLLNATWNNTDGVHWHKTISFNGDYSLCIMESSIPDMHLATLMSSAKMMFSLGRLLYSRRDLVLELMRIVQVRGNTPTLQQCLQEGPNTHEAYQLLQGIVRTQRELINLTKMILNIFLAPDNDLRFNQLLKECLLYVGSEDSVIEMMFDAMTSERFRWYNPEGMLQRREGRTIDLINEVKSHIYRRPTQEEGVEPVAMAIESNMGSQSQLAIAPQTDDVTFRELVQDDILFNENEGVVMVTGETACAQENVSLPSPSNPPSLSSRPTDDHLVLRMIDTGDFIEVVPTTLTQKETQDEWIVLSYKDSSAQSADLVIILDQVEVDEDFVEVVPIPFVFRERDDDWLEISPKRRAVDPYSH